uniref:Peptidase M13 C-terminal domain-containing protein n=1 Tax=Acrobeloides nanus TaxID=290746 RepID=A0A914C697_9BILA
ALLKYLDSSKEEARISGLEQYTEKQLFFFNYAFSWCSKQRLEASIYQILNDNHSPPEARVNVVLGNLPEFSDAFQCPLGSPMNPIKKCRVW